MIPELLRHMNDVGCPNLDNGPLNEIDEETEEENLNKKQLYKVGFPLRVFGKVSI